MNQPKLYSKYNDLQKTDNVYVLDNYLRLTNWKNNEETILDVGCGDGKFAVEILIPRLPKNIGKFIGCDSSEIMVKFAKENYKYPSTDFVHFDISSDTVLSGFETGFDHIFSFYTMHWVKNQRQAFKNIYKMLKPGGDILITFLASNPIYDVYQTMSKNKKWKPYWKKEYIAPYHGIKDPERKLQKMLTELGFVCHICKLENRTYMFQNFGILEKSIAAVNPIISKLPPQETANYVQDFMKEVRKLKCITIENFNNNEESIHFLYKIFIVFATKPTL